MRQEHLPANQLPLALWLESDRMAFLLASLDEHTLTNVRRTVLNEYLLRTSSVPAGLAPRFLFEALFPGTHPYHSILDDDGDIAAIGLGDLQWFFQNYYGPQNATLVIAGNIDTHETLDLVTQYFGTIPRGAGPSARTAPALPRATAERRITVDVPFLRGPITVAWATPPEYEPGDAALDVLAMLLRDTPSSGLRDRLITRGAIADSVSVNQRSYQYASVFEIDVIPRRGAYIATVLPIIEEAVQNLRVLPLDQTQIYVASSRLALERQLEWQDPLARAQRLEGYDSHDGNPDGLANDIARYTRLDRASLHEAAQRWLATDQRVVETIYAAPHAPLAGRLAASGLRGEGGAL